MPKTNKNKNEQILTHKETKILFPYDIEDKTEYLPIKQYNIPPVG